jgi:hypothetical protein
MSDVEITIKLPEELVERARAEGVRLDNVTEDVIELLENRIERKAALRRLLDLADQIDRLPNDLKPTPEEIEAEIRAARAERADLDERWSISGDARMR